MAACQPKAAGVTLIYRSRARAKVTTSVNCLAGYHAPNSASRFLHIALAARDQMHMGVVNRLPSSFAAVHADIEAAYQSILFHYVGPHFIQ